ncbi:UDP-glucose 4-epimerase family protein [Vibrio pectenicida]|uniref:SDR family oxidoreductase n=1 Tax=Vibrio pectenicida TaxID=62763 RepID=A0A3R9EGG1_9VIBR|nr:SDR family oxidoreductase [Vibrio pectenicida]RSD29867.1 SDR family oxidoreductase [Vibrio pectenicida]
MKVVITGATGFVGKYLLQSLPDRYLPVILGRSKPVGFQGKYYEYDLHDEVITTSAFVNAEVVIHTAARVHAMNDTSESKYSLYKESNVDSTIRLAEHAFKNGVKRFIFISSIKVNGESTQPCAPFSVFDNRLPEDDYGRSKSEAEVELLKLAEATGLEVVIIRPTLVYGPGVKANFSALLKLVERGIPLPFGCIKHNKRSFVSVRNLVDLIFTCIEHPRAVNQVFLVSDGKDLSTLEMVRLMGQSMGKRVWQVPVPIWLFTLVGKMLGKSDIVNRLVGSLHVDISKNKNMLDWAPPQSIEEGFLEIVVSKQKN